jgi:parvulin-like peptidyl-prolyl isomerase
MIKLAYFLFVLLLLPVTAFAQNEGIVARVGGVPITTFELQRQINQIMPMRVGFHGGVSAERINEIQQDALNTLIERGYKVKYAIDHEISAPVAKVDEQLKKIKSKFKSSEDFQQAVSAETEAGLRGAIYRQLLADEAEKVAVSDKITISEADVRAYYDQNKQMFFMPQQYRASHILIKVDPASNQEERKILQEKAEQLLKRAKDGEDFFDLAYFNSDDRTKYVGGDLGMFHDGQTEKPFEDALKTLKVGEISDLVKTRYGFHIIKLTQVNEPRQLTFDEMQLKLKTRLEKDQRDKLYAAWMDELKQKYPLEKLID